MERRRDGKPDHLEGVTVQRDGLAETQVRCLGKGPLDHHTTGSDPRPVRHLGLVDRGHARLTPFDLHRGNEVRTAHDGTHRAGVTHNPSLGWTA